MITYRITYINRGIVQTKNLVDLDTYTNIIKPLEHKIYEIQCELYNCSRKNKVKKEALEKQKAEEERKLGKYGEYFVVGSPLYKAISTGILVLPKTQGGEHLVSFEKI